MGRFISEVEVAYKKSGSPGEGPKSESLHSALSIFVFPLENQTNAKIQDLGTAGK